MAGERKRLPKKVPGKRVQGKRVSAKPGTGKAVAGRKAPGPGAPGPGAPGSGGAARRKVTGRGKPDRPAVRTADGEKAVSGRKRAEVKKTGTRKTRAQKTASGKGAPVRTGLHRTPADKVSPRRISANRLHGHGDSAGRGTPADVLSLGHLACALAGDCKIPRKQVEELLAAFVDRTGGYLAEGKKLRIAGLGALEVRQMADRPGRKPAVGGKTPPVPVKRIVFRPARDLKERVL